jgi:mannose-6-phosphate isomerase
MMLDHPLRFAPLFRRYLWGGRRLGTLLGKAIGSEADYAESWEIVDRGADQSVVLAGPLAGCTLRELMSDFRHDLLGRYAALAQFPLLFKFLDCCRDLSLQVHPNDEQARQLTPPDLGKTEAWVILDAAPGSKAYAGWKPGIDQAAVQREIAREALPDCLHQLQPKAGDCLFIPAGVVHALGEGLLVAEIQQASDTTYRLFDWNRVGADGKPRPLHVEQALEVTDFRAGPIAPQTPQPTPRPFVEQLVACNKFILDRWTFDTSEHLAGDDRFHLLAVLDGEVVLENDPVGTPLGRGQTVLVPAACRQRLLTPNGRSVLLDIYLPD